jgi:5-methylcytosine-specific restriction endonuclease McrA
MRKIRVIILEDINYYKGVSVRYLYGHQLCRCFYCGRFMTATPYIRKVNPHGFTKDHLFPKSLGFTLSGNTVLSCRPCNHKKENDMPTHAEIKLAMLLYSNMQLPFVCRMRWKQFS